MLHGVSPATRWLTANCLSAWLLVCCTSCEKPSAGDGARQSDTPASDAASTAWRAGAGAGHVVVIDKTTPTSLDNAIAQALQTLEDARTCWKVASPADRANWSIKWAARTLEGGVEHVWIRPMGWSPWRIEGTLLSTPTRELECGAQAGEAVSFPSEEVTDWLFLIDGRIDGPRNGGFTLDALTDTFGAPPALEG